MHISKNWSFTKFNVDALEGTVPEKWLILYGDGVKHSPNCGLLDKWGGPALLRASPALSHTPYQTHSPKYLTLVLSKKLVFFSLSNLGFYSFSKLKFFP